MEDEKIVELFLNRDEAAIAEAKQKYGGYIKKTAYNILGDFEDGEECLNDALLRAWNSIPPQNPANLKSYLSMLARRCGFFEKKGPPKARLRRIFRLARRT